MLYHNAGCDTESADDNVICSTRTEVVILKRGVMQSENMIFMRIFAIFQAFSLCTSHYLRSVRGDYLSLISSLFYPLYYFQQLIIIVIYLQIKHNFIYYTTLTFSPKHHPNYIFHKYNLLLHLYIFVLVLYRHKHFVIFLLNLRHYFS